MKSRYSNEFYKVGYKFDSRHMYACYFSIEAAQEAMMKMMVKGVEVTGMESQKL
jgi:hypothetical protein